MVENIPYLNIYICGKIYWIDCIFWALYVWELPKYPTIGDEEKMHKVVVEIA